MKKTPLRSGLNSGRLRHLSTHGLPLALTLLLAACGGGDSSSSGNTSLKSQVSANAAAEVALTPVSATGSSSERGDLNGAAAIDRNMNTRWGSGFSDTEYLTLDFGKSEQISRVRIDWENAHATKYLLQVSDDNQNWTTIKTVDNSQGGTEDVLVNGQGRYLRMQGVARSSQYGYSIFEIQAFSGTPVVAPDPTPEPDPDPVPLPDPGPIDTTKPGVPVKPVAATSSTPENGGLSAALAIDGKANTRWASKSEDDAWIQFDFGVKTQVGYMKLLWENSYGKQYKLRVSDDGVNWSQLRYITNGKGGTEEFFNLGVNSRYIQLQGVQRATQYGYSLFEVEFKSPGSDNTVPTAETSAFRFPASGNGWTPLPTYDEPLETLQFTLADGTLVTRFGVRGVGRHGRERGEDWEVGFPGAINQTIDPITGMPVDKGPGNYLTFVPNYFQNRTWGIEVIDNSRVPGVTKPMLKVNEYMQTDNLAGGIAFFRAFDRPGATGYGWMNNGELAVNDGKVCKSTPYPANGRLYSANGINSSCTLLIRDYPGHGDLDAEGYPNGKNVPARPLVVGDAIEMSPSMFAAPGAMPAKGDNGGIRYYSTEMMYVVGQGLRPWVGVFPRLNSAPLPAETLTGGLGSVSYDYADNGSWMFQQPATNIGMQNMQRFVEGRRLIHTNLTTGEHNEPGNDRFTRVAGLQGPRFNQSSCFACHDGNGTSPAPLAVNQRLDKMSVRVAVTNANGQQVPHPQYGTAIQMNGAAANGAPQDWGTGVRVAGFETSTVKLADGTSVELRKPTLAFDGPVPENFSLRSAQRMVGVGLLEAVPEADILARVRTTPDADGVKGVANFAYDPETGAVRLGRFGWKAAKASLRQQSAEALLLDMSVTSPIYPNRACANGPVSCAAGGTQKGISEADLQSITHYLELLAVPAQRSVASGFPKGVAPLPDLDVNPAQVNLGAQVFKSMNCAACHTVEMKTGSGHLLAELRNQTFRPYTDLLLHDMGPKLADKFIEGQAKGSYWRTAPLMGIGYADKVAGGTGKAGLLHDGRARNVTEAIMWHGGEAEASRQRFEKLSKADRDALLTFMKSL
ncbi:di-heme oxidoredictase family protein [Janthinobacterium agaricidamnosum]|uniref:Cytochrome c family protein n=1 Tax=Janthinobacterium agaricidamnosum NBRC 102515 = DSM 9628 TaxID=1349767 RepID=W0V2Q3_9BURK|nr:di-heme oxidoredictase family protein [Janthinobacterium agaricidamnosum]CDG83104.1 conserved hypothetical protein [Janthinobacterium agaricidamnosum NBRC 102515 = DSM 9628]